MGNGTGNGTYNLVELPPFFEGDLRVAMIRCNEAVLRLLKEREAIDKERGEFIKKVETVLPEDASALVNEYQQIRLRYLRCLLQERTLAGARAELVEGVRLACLREHQKQEKELAKRDAALDQIATQLGYGSRHPTMENIRNKDAERSRIIQNMNDLTVFPGKFEVEMERDTVVAAVIKGELEAFFK